MKTISPKNAKFVAVVENVKELRLIGTANLDFWNKQLAEKPFQAFDNEGFAEITISATELVWKGFRFNEFTFILTIAERNNPPTEAGVFLIHAFNSNRFFAFCERFFFSTPYYFGKVNFRETAPFSIDSQNFKAEMSEKKHQFHEADDNWEGAVFLSGGNYFVAKLLGKSKVYLFDETDKIEFKSEVEDDVFNLLNKSGFVGKEWRWRGDAFHAKSKTYRFASEK